MSAEKPLITKVYKLQIEVDPKSEVAKVILNGLNDPEEPWIFTEEYSVSANRGRKSHRSDQETIISLLQQVKAVLARAGYTEQDFIRLYEFTITNIELSEPLLEPRKNKKN